MVDLLARTFNVDDFESLARKVLPRPVFDFYAGGAEDERTLRANRQAFEVMGLAPRVLVDVSAPNTQVELLGAGVSMPVVVAPMGAVGFGCRKGDEAIAAAAAAAGIPYILSSTATASIETIASVSSGRKWFQLYPLKRADLMWRLVDRARAAGFEALVITVDVPVGGKRERDLHNDFAMPFRFTARNLSAFAMRPKWAAGMLMQGVPVMENLKELAPEGSKAAGLASSVGAGFDCGFTWQHLAELRRRWHGPLLVKGVLHPSDAAQAKALGCDGVIVSNHGGRQLDSGVSALSCLADIVDQVGSGMEVYMDGGVRRGSDIVKALARGAKGVLMGRPLLFGACVAGQPGAERVLAILKDELLRTLQLCGVAELAAISSELVQQPCTSSSQASSTTHHHHLLNRHFAIASRDTTHTQA